jgi:AcrR family transcriptional regulator
MSRSVADTRARILEAAIGLFDMQGIRSATIDSIAALAGVTKRTLYNHFRSKDDLIAVSLSESCMAERSNLADSQHNDQELDEMVRLMFANVVRSAGDPRWKGCLFTRAAIELAGLPGHPAIAAGKAEKNRIERMFTIKLNSLEVSNAEVWARRLVILLDGAISHSIVHHDPRYALEAGQMALELIASAKLNPLLKDSRTAYTKRSALVELEDLRAA